VSASLIAAALFLTEAAVAEVIVAAVMAQTMPLKNQDMVK